MGPWGRGIIAYLPLIQFDYNDDVVPFPQRLWVIFSRVRFSCTTLASLVSNSMFEIAQSQFRLQWRYAPIDREFVPKKRLVWCKGWYGKQDGKSNKDSSSWSSYEVKFFVQGFEVAQEIWPPKNSPLKMCHHIDSHVVFSSSVQSSPLEDSWL